MPQTVNINGQAFSIASLKVGQFREIVKLESEAAAASDPWTHKLKAISYSLNNARTAGVPVRTPEDLEATLDVQECLALYTEVLKASALKVGETQAATESPSISGTSAAA